MRWIVRILSLLILLALLAGGALLLIPSKQVAKLAERQFEAATGRKMTLTGTVRPTLWPRLGVRTGPVEIANASWSKTGPMVSAKGLDIGVDPLALLRGDIKISKVEVVAPKIILERQANGTGNWEFTPTAAAKAAAKPTGSGKKSSTTEAASGGIQAFSLDKGTIKDGAITWIDHGTGQRIALSKIDATLAIPSFTGPAKLTMTAEANGKPLKLSGTLGQFAAFLSGKVVTADLTSAIGASTIGFKGEMGTDPVAAKGTLDAKLTDPAALAAILGQSAPALPRGLGHDRITAKGEVTLAPEGSMHLRGGKITLDDNAMNVAADVTFPGGQPTINAQISAGALDLSSLAASSGGGGTKGSAGGTSSGGAKAPAASGWSKAPIDASGLGAADATVSLTASSINLGTVKLGKTQALVTLKGGRAQVDLRQLAAYGGNVAGQVVVNSRGGLSVASDLTAKGISMRPLLTDLAGYKRLGSTGNFRVKLLASGNSEAALARSLSGNGSFNLGKGELQGLDIVGMLRTLNPNYVGEGAKTIFDSISASFTIAGGVLSNDDLAFKAPLLSAAGKGTVNIGAQTLDYTVTPTAMTKADGTGGVQVPLNITGPWASPKFGLDLKAIADEKLAVEKKKLQDKAKAEAQKQLQKSLGVTPQEGQSTRDAVKKKLEDEAKKGLLNLLK